MKQKFKRFWLLMTMLFTVIYSHAYDFAVGGIYYNIVSIPDMTCEVTFGEESYSGDIIIPSTVEFSDRTFHVTKFNKCAFIGSKITSIKYPDTITELSESLFQDCKELNSIEIRENIKKIGEAVFQGCTNLENVKFLNNLQLTELPPRSFNGCISLKTIIIPDNIKIIGNETFKDCSNLSVAILPETVEEIGAYSFYNCSSLEQIKLPVNLKKIDSYAYCGTHPTFISQFPEGLEFIGSHAFQGVDYWDKISLPSSVSLGGDAFNNCPRLKELRISTHSLDNSVNLPASLISIIIFCDYHCNERFDYACSPKYGSSKASSYYDNNNYPSIFNKIPESVTSLKLETEGVSHYSFFNIGKDYDAPNYSLNKEYFESYVKNIKYLHIDNSATAEFIIRRGKSQEYSTSLNYFYTSNYGLSSKFWESLEVLYLDRNIEEKFLTYLNGDFGWYRDSWYTNCISNKNLKHLILGEHIYSLDELSIASSAKLTSLSLNPPKIPTLSNEEYMNLEVEVPAEALEVYKNAEGWKHFWNLKAIDTSGINSPSISYNDKKTEVSRYNINGQKVDDNYKGIVIIRYSDGTTKKIFANN